MVLISCQMLNLQCAIFKIATCEEFLINTKILSFFKKKSKTMHHTKKIPGIRTFFFHISVPNFKALGQIIKNICTYVLSGGPLIFLEKKVCILDTFLRESCIYFYL